MSSINKGRVLAIIQFLLAVLILFFSYINKSISSGIFQIIGTIVMIMGILLLFISMINFRQIITPNPVPLQSAILITKGIYKYVRHPMYLSGIIIVLGWCIYFTSILLITLMIVLILFFVFKVKFEEAKLIEKFPEYSEYKKRTNRFLPFLY